MMSERESLIKLDLQNLTGEHEGKLAFFCYSYEDPSYPINPKVIRMTTFQGNIMETSGDDTRCVQYSMTNMGGYFPMRLLRLAASAMIKKQMETVMG